MRVHAFTHVMAHHVSTPYTDSFDSSSMSIWCFYRVSKSIPCRSDGEGVTLIVGSANICIYLSLELIIFCIIIFYSLEALKIRWNIVGLALLCKLLHYGGMHSFESWGTHLHQLCGPFRGGAPKSRLDYEKRLDVLAPPRRSFWPPSRYLPKKMNVSIHEDNAHKKISDERSSHACACTVP